MLKKTIGLMYIQSPQSRIIPVELHIHIMTDTFRRVQIGSCTCYDTGTRFRGSSLANRNW